MDLTISTDLMMDSMTGFQAAAVTTPIGLLPRKWNRSKPSMNTLMRPANRQGALRSGHLQLAEKLNGNQEVDGFLWAILYNRIPEALKDTVLTPFISVADNQTRFYVRVIESASDLNRNELLQRIERGVEEEFGLADEDVRVTGILVMYNNVLQSLFQSQILTLGVVMLAIMLMFLALFRSLSIAVICIDPNAIAAAFVLASWDGQTFRWIS